MTFIKLWPCTLYYKINDIIICHMFLSFLSKKEKIQSMKFIKLDIYKGFIYSTEREKGKRKDESCETIDIWEDQEI